MYLTIIAKRIYAFVLDDSVFLEIFKNLTLKALCICYHVVNFFANKTEQNSLFF